MGGEGSGRRPDPFKALVKSTQANNPSVCDTMVLPNLSGVKHEIKEGTSGIIPDLKNTFVPYTGATADLNLNNKTLIFEGSGDTPNELFQGYGDFHIHNDDVWAQQVLSTGNPTDGRSSIFFGYIGADDTWTFAPNFFSGYPVNLGDNYYDYFRFKNAYLSGLLDVDNLIIQSGSITDDTGSISFGDENLTTTGNLGLGGTASTRFHLKGNSSSHYGTIDTGLNYTSVTKPSAPTATLLGVAGSITPGQHRYAVSYVTDLGETEISDPSNTVTTSAGNGQVSITGISVSSDYRVKARKIFRTIDPAGDGGSDSLYHFKLLTTINDNTTTSYSPDNIADAGLSGGTNYPGFYYQDNTTNKFILLDGTPCMYVGNKLTTLGKFAGSNLVIPSYDNTLLGYQTGQVMTTASGNTCVGAIAGRSITTGWGNCLLGSVCGHAITGSSNVASGLYCLYAGGSGSGNVALGYAVNFTGQIGNYNVYLGHGVSDNATGSTNVSIGAYSGLVSTGSNNLFLGSYAGRYETAGQKIIIDTLSRGNEATQRAEAPIYAVTDSTVANQRMTFNAVTDVTQDFYFTGSGTGLPYGSMYGDDISQTITISASSTYYALTAGLSGGSENLMTFQNAREIKCLKAGKYKVDWSMSLECATAGQYVEGAVMINTTAQQNTVGACEIPSANKKVCVGGTGIITLAVNDLVKLCVENETGTNDIIVDHANLSIVQVGG